MTQGKILYNNIKEYTPKWFPTIPYLQTIKQVFGRKPQVVSTFNANPSVKSMWRALAFVFQRHSFMWQVLIVFVAFASFHICYDPLLFIYKSNNMHRTYEACMKKERSHKKKLKEIQKAEDDE